MAIKQFLNFSKEKINNESDKIVERIAKVYSIGNRIHKTDKKDVVISRISYAEAFQAF